MKLSLPTWIGIGLVALLAGLFAFQFLSPRNNRHSFLGNHFDRPEPAETFQLTDHTGAPFDLKNQRGKIVLLTFGFTHCPDVCPTILNHLTDAYEQLTPEEQAKVQVVFVTLDPERDTVAVLKDYVPFFEKNFIGLTGSPEATDAVAKKYHVFYRKVPLDGANYNLDHSTHLFLVDPSGNFSVLYDSKEIANTDRFVGDLRAILSTPKNTN